MSDALLSVDDIHTYLGDSHIIQGVSLGVPAGNNVWGAVVWCLVLIAIFAPLAVRKYRRTAGR